MKLLELYTQVGKDGSIIVSEDIVNAVKLRPGDEVCVSLQNELKDSLKAGIIDEDELNMPAELLEASGIPEDSDLDVICIDGAVIIMEADILNNLPDKLRELFDMLGICPDTVREVMRKEGYFI